MHMIARCSVAHMHAAQSSDRPPERLCRRQLSMQDVSLVQEAAPETKSPAPPARPVLPVLPVVPVAPLLPIDPLRRGGASQQFAPVAERPDVHCDGLRDDGASMPALAQANVQGTMQRDRVSPSDGTFDSRRVAVRS